MKNHAVRRIFVALLAILAGGGTLTAARTGPLSTSELLVHLARDHGLKQRGQQTPADVKHVQALLEAAVRLDADQAHAYTWLYELARLRGDQDAADQAAVGLLKADPTHEGAFSLWLAAGLRSQHTLEDRETWLRAVLKTQRPPTMTALVHAELARIQLERLDTTAARQELKTALALEPACVEAATLMLACVPDDAPPGAELATLLRVIELRPFALDLVWRTARLLDEHGFPSSAEPFYDYVVAVEAKQSPDVDPPAAFLLDMARNQFSLDKLDEAVKLAERAVAGNPADRAEAGWLLRYLLARADRPIDAARVSRRLKSRFAAIRDPDEFPVNEVAQAAWFYSTVDDQPERALLLARNAFDRAPSDDFVRRVLGWALERNNQPDRAMELLQPIARRDPYAAYMRARIRQQQGDIIGALRAALAIDPPPRPGPAQDLLASLQLDLPADQAAAERYPQIPAALADFDERVLSFHEDPAAILEARVVPVSLSPRPGEPWWTTFSLTNRGPYPLTLGPDGMVNPVFLITIRMEGDRNREYPALMSISVDRDRVLYPGETVRVRRALNVGPLRTASRHTPQHMQRIALDVILDAGLDASGDWRPSPGGQQLDTVYFNRVPAATGHQAMEALFNTLASGDLPQRALAIEVLAELLGEWQRGAIDRLSYEPDPIPTRRIHGALLSLLSSDSWELRARALDAIQVMGLDRKLTAAVDDCLSHPHWLVRLLATRVVARQGKSAAERVGSIARNDRDDIVRVLAESYLQAWGINLAPADEQSPTSPNPPSTDN